MAITPAMREGSGMVRFSKEFPSQYYDAAIAEQHAVTLGAGLACEGLTPVIAIYSSFLQRGYDQLIHDVALQNLPVMFAIDRAGLVGADGETHQGAFDISFMRCIPNLVIMAPSDLNECRQMLYTGHLHTGPSAVRYPRGSAGEVEPDKELTAIKIGQSRQLRAGKKLAILNFGTLLDEVKTVANELDASLLDMRFIKPIDEAAIKALVAEHDIFVTLEDNAVMGGAGSAVNEFVMAQKLNVSVLNLGLPDEFIKHGTQQEMHHEHGLDQAGIKQQIEQYLAL
jgi:1-deoxy-D-xylulose-5-phosphate synthase